MTLACLSTVGLILSSYLSWQHLAGGSVPGCGDGSPCDQVLNSRWSSIGGVIPVSGLAVGAYLALWVAILSIAPTTELAVRRLAWQALLLLAGTVAGAAVWFFIVQKWIIGSFCPYCLAVHLIGFLVAVVVIWRATSQSANSLAAPPVIDVRPALLTVSVGVVLAGLLAGSQVLFAPPAAYHTGESRNSVRAVDPHSAPLVGSSNAASIVTLLFDYKCAHCQQMHFMLNEVVRRFDGQLAFVLCPAPLNTQCNPYVPRDVEAFTESCDLARLALAVWRSDRAAFAAFEDWLFALESGDRWQPRSRAAAQARAVELIGQARLDAALADPWIDDYLQTSVQIYGETTAGGNTAVPKLVFGSRWMIPQPNDVDDLVLLLRERLLGPQP